MPRIIVLIVFALSVTSASSQVEKLKLHERGVWPFAAGGKEFVVRSPAELVAAINGKRENDGEEIAVAALVKALKVKDIDWKTKMLVVVRLERVHPSYLSEFRSIETEGKKAIVHYGFYLPGAARPLDKPPTPVAYSFMALVDRFDGEVHFNAEVRSPR